MQLAHDRGARLRDWVGDLPLHRLREWLSDNLRGNYKEKKVIELRQPLPTLEVSCKV